MDRYRSQVIEVINRNTVVSLALDQGYNAYLPVYDGGVDFILYRESDGDLRKVQLKGRWTIDRKYLERDIWVAFPIGDRWFLAPHDAMVKMGEARGYTRAASWADKGNYSLPNPSADIRKACEEYNFGNVETIRSKTIAAGTEP